MANSVLAPSCTNVRAVFVRSPTGGADLPGRAETRRTVVTPKGWYIRKYGGKVTQGKLQIGAERAQCRSDFCVVRSENERMQERMRRGIVNQRCESEASAHDGHFERFSHGIRVFIRVR